MPRSKEEIQQLMVDISRGYKGKAAGVLYPEEPLIQNIEQPPILQQPGLMKDPSINYDNISNGYATIGRIDSPEYKQNESELSQASEMLRAFPNDPKAKDWSNQVALKKSALERIRSGK